jgi:hypothetical protein
MGMVTSTENLLVVSDLLYIGGQEQMDTHQFFVFYVTIVMAEEDVKRVVIINLQ